MKQRTLARHIAVRMQVRMGYSGITAMFARLAAYGHADLPPREAKLREAVWDELCRIDARRVARWRGPVSEPRPIPDL